MQLKKDKLLDTGEIKVYYLLFRIGIRKLYWTKRMIRIILKEG